MTQRTKLELPINQPTTITLLYDEPVSGQSKYGSYHLYAVAIEDDEYSFFPTEEVYEQIKHLKKGDTFTITKLASQRGSKLVTAFDVKLSAAAVKVPATVSSAEQPDEQQLHDRYFDIMLDSYRDALEISKELNGMADPEKIAVTLFIARSKQSY
ncbi:hypothetical protein C4588_05000 [Candidatus Parcubacteria bacterium]|jgi:hypothetical protein|nr:MAG: hypothetical protein C4588_05000 [Candidatus Parcubacteria bacterium]